MFIREAIAIADAEEKERQEKEKEEDEGEDDGPGVKKKDYKGKGKEKPEFDWHQVHLGSPQPEVTFAEFESSTAPADPAFNNFRGQLSFYLTRLFSIPENRPFELPESEHAGFKVGFEDDDMVQFTTMLRNSQNNSHIMAQLTECGYFKVDYESAVSGRLNTDYLRCNPFFFKKGPQYDAIIYMDSGDKQAFGRLFFMFVCEVRKKRIPMALIHPLNRGIGAISPKDVDLGLCRLKGPPRKETKFIPLRSVICGALLVREDGRSEEYIAIDTVDRHVCSPSSPLSSAV